MAAENQNFDASQEESITKIGLLMEAALTHQSAAQTVLRRLQSHTQGLDAIVREEIRRTLVEELQELSAECKRATQALQSVKRAAGLRTALWTIGITGICLTLVLAAARWLLPSPDEIAALREEGDRYAQVLAQLERRGGRVDLRRCGNGERLCVRVDREAPVFGEQKDYFVVQGY